MGPLLVAMVSGQFIGEHLRAQDIVGVVLLSAGLVTLAIPLKSVIPKPGARHGLATLFAVLTGFTIAGYIISDGLGVRAAGPDASHRLAYIAWLCVLEGPWLLVFAVMVRPETVWSHLRRNWWRGVVGGLIANTGYGIAIYALALGPMAHVAALRETSVLFGALMGTLLLGEPFGVPPCRGRRGDRVGPDPDERTAASLIGMRILLDRSRAGSRSPTPLSISGSRTLRRAQACANGSVTIPAGGRRSAVPMRRSCAVIATSLPGCVPGRAEGR